MKFILRKFHLKKIYQKNYYGDQRNISKLEVILITEKMKNLMMYKIVWRIIQGW